MNAMMDLVYQTVNEINNDFYKRLDAEIERVLTVEISKPFTKEKVSDAKLILVTFHDGSCCITKDGERISNIVVKLSWEGWKEA